MFENVQRIMMWTGAITLILSLGSTVHAAVTGPYTADANTLFLYHLDETSGALVNDGAKGTGFNLTNTGGATGRDGAGSGGYGATAYTGFGNAFDAYGSGDGTFHSGTASDGGGAHTESVTQSQADYQAAGGAFTYEALIKTPDLGPTAEHQIISRDNGTTSSRGFIFYIVNGDLTFFNGGASGVSAAIPTTGGDAFVANEWFHVAISYTGNEGVADNVSFYWTRVVESATAANLIGNATLTADANAATTDLFIGATGRDSYRREISMIDEVRISDVVRGANDFIFAPASVPTPAAGSAGLVLLSVVAMRRRSH